MNKDEIQQAIESIRAVTLGMYLNLVATKYGNLTEEQLVDMINDSDLGRQYIFYMTDLLGEKLGIDISKLSTAQELFDIAGKRVKKAESEVDELRKLYDL
jgi:hypothetical protein